jgi:glycosyltransferase involved in cell wall biosynthesis
MDDYKKSVTEMGIESQCIFYGEIDREKIAEFFSKADLLVLPSRYETFGVVLIEAMACGIPVIATRCGGPEDIVTEATGLLIEKDNVGELTSALLYMSEHLDSYNKETIIGYARDHFGKQVFIKKTMDLYNEILKNNSNG